MRFSPPRRWDLRFWVLGFFLVWMGGAYRSVNAADNIAPQLRAQVQKARVNLGDLPAWQEEIFENEILPASGRFVRDYKAVAGQVTKAEIDLEGMKRYLAFNASQILKPESNKVLLFVRADAKCGDCIKSVGGVRGDLKARLERRGFTVLIPTAEELRRDPSEVYAKRNASGWVTVDMRSVDDADHPGEEHYTLALDLRFPGTLVSGTQKQMDVLPGDSIEISIGRLTIDAMLGLSQKVRTGFASAAADSAGVELTLEGITKFSMLTQVKFKLQGVLGSDYRVVEKSIERDGKASLAILGAGGGGDANGTQVAENLRKASFEGFNLQITNVGTDNLRARAIVAGASRGGRS